MNEPITPSVSSSGGNAGDMLREARQAQGLQIDALASMIKVTPAKLDALEQGRYEQLPDANFTRALAMTVCRSLKIDPAPVLAALPAAKAIPLSPHKPALNQPFKESRGANLSFDSGDSFDLKTVLRPQWLAPILLLLASAGVYFMPDSVQWPHWFGGVGTKPGAVAPSASAASAPAQAPVAPAASDPASVAAESAPSSADLASVASAIAESAGSQAASAPASATSTTVGTATAPVTGAESNTPASSAGSLVLMSHEPAWVEVRDGKGGILLSRHLQAGETVDLSGVPPLKLHLGNSAGLEVIYRGQPIELASYTRNNVARLELK